MNKINIKDLSGEELSAKLKEINCPAFRAKQINDWLYKKQVTSFAEMLNLPVKLREQLEESFHAYSLQVKEELVADDQTCKALLELHDGNTIETVLMPGSKRNTVCISTQVGCPVRCVFCASGRNGLVRDLTAGEIIDQVIWSAKKLGKRIDNIVVMGIGEPLLNLDNLIHALKIINSPDHLNIGNRHITVSTSGIAPAIKELADKQQQWNLALSLHATDDEKRAKLIPPKYRYPLDEIFAACKYYREKTNRMITLEYALIDGENISNQAAHKLVDIARKLRAKINLIPHNPVDNEISAPSQKQIKSFSDIIIKKYKHVTIRNSRGEQIKAACGQLRLKNQNNDL